LCCAFANADRMSFGEGATEVLQLSSAGIRHDGPPEPPGGKPDDRQREDSSSRVPFSSESVNFGDLGEETRLAGRGVLVVAGCLSSPSEGQGGIFMRHRHWLVALWAAAALAPLPGTAAC
jgi:hypothetical protein